MLHFLEMAMQTAHLVLSPAFRDWFVIIASGNSLCRLFQLSEWYELVMDKEVA
jgi:hypothetical protein